MLEERKVLLIVKILNRPLATTTQFRAAVKQIVTERFSDWNYTDKPRSEFVYDSGKRYVKISSIKRETMADIEAIEFILWAQGVTAHTRLCTSGVRGTCILPKKVR